MTRYNDATARAKFDACGYGETCEFVKVEGDRLTARCRECGHEFTRDNVILRKPQKKLRCRACYERKMNDAIEWYAAGHTFRECADKFGLTPNQVSNQIQRRGVHGGISKDENSRRLQEHNGSAKGNAVQMKRAGERIRHRVALHGFDMLDEWRGEDAAYRVCCARCGHEFELKAQTLKKCKFACPECPDPFDVLRAELDDMRNLVRTIERELMAAKSILDKLDRWTCGEHSWYRDTLEAHSPQAATCKHCGTRWVYWPTITRGGYHKYARQAYCSKKCRARANRSSESSNIGHRLRKYGSQDKPRDVIKLDELIERDGGICHLCGEATNKKDSWLDENGYHVCGAKYPTIDHVIPLSKGGTHTWNNVKLACRNCNSHRGSKALDEIFSNEKGS